MILGADTRANSIDLFKKLDYIPFYDEAKINIKCILLSKCLSGDCPSYLNDILTSNRDIYSRNSRYGSTYLVCPVFPVKLKGVDPLQYQYDAYGTLFLQ